MRAASLERARRAYSSTEHRPVRIAFEGTPGPATEGPAGAAAARAAAGGPVIPVLDIDKSASSRSSHASSLLPPPTPRTVAAWERAATERAAMAAAQQRRAESDQRTVRIAAELADVNAAIEVKSAAARARERETLSGRAADADTIWGSGHSICKPR